MSSASAALRRVAALCGQDSAPGRRLERWALMIDRAPADRVHVLLSAIATIEPALMHIRPDPDVPNLAPKYPLAPREYAARIVLGESPAQISRGLTRAEAHVWMTEAPNSEPAEWLLDRCRMPQSIPEIRSVKVARWLIERWRDPEQRSALERPRREIMAGQAIEGSYLSRADELRERDLRPSVEDTYRRAAERIRAQIERSLKSRGEPLRAPPQWWSRARPAKCSRILLSGADLVAEGRAMQHCVASYAVHVRAGRSVIVGLCVLGQRSTVEIDPRTMVVRQHRGRANAEPPELCERALRVLMRRWRKAGGME